MVTTVVLALKDEMGAGPRRNKLGELPRMQRSSLADAAAVARRQDGKVQVKQPKVLQTSLIQEEAKPQTAFGAAK